MKTHIIIHVLPFEIDRFEHQMFELRKNGHYLDKGDEVVIISDILLRDKLINAVQMRIVE